MQNILALIAESRPASTNPLPPPGSTSQVQEKMVPVGISADSMVIHSQSQTMIRGEEFYFYYYREAMAMLYIFIVLMTLIVIGWNIYKKSGRELYISIGKILGVALILMLILYCVSRYIFTF